MVLRARHITRSLVTSVVLLIVVFGIPILLTTLVGWPLPTTVPKPSVISTALEQRNIAGEVVVSVLALIVWILWAQFVWALLWEAVVNGRRLGPGHRVRPAPLVVGPLNTLAVKLLSGLMAASVAATTASAYLTLPTSPTLAAVPAVEHLTPSSDSDVGGPSPSVVPSTVDSGGPRWLVKDGDSLWSIAETTFGDGDRSRDVLTLNPELTSARSVRPGMVLSMPVGAAIPTDRIPPISDGSTVGGSLPALEVEIEPGDNLWDLSENRLEGLGPDPSAGEIVGYVDEVVAANDDAIDEPDLIFPGQVFTFPEVNGLGVTTSTEASEPVAAPGDPAPTGDTANGTAPNGDGANGTGSNGTAANGLVPNGAGSNGASPNGSVARVPASDSPDRPTTTVDGGGVIDSGPDRDESAEDPTTTVVLGAGGALLAAGVAGLVRRRRRYRQSQRSPGTVPRDPDKDAAPMERALRYQADSELRRWLTTAMDSLAGRPVWEGEQVAQPLVARLTDDYLEVTFSKADAMAAPVPWIDTGDATRWRLPRLVMEEELSPLDGPAPAPTLVTVGVGTLVNLEGLGVLTIGGTGGEPMDLVRSIVHELATSPSAGIVDVRSTIPVAGTESYGLVRCQPPDDLVAELIPWLDDVTAQLSSGACANAYAQRLSRSEDPIGPVVVVTDRAGYDTLRPVVERAAGGGMPLGVVVVGALSSLASLGGHSMALRSDGARLEPLGIDVRPQLLDVEVARKLGDLLTDAGRQAEEPLVVGLQLSASVTDIRRVSRLQAPPATDPESAPVAEANELDVADAATDDDTELEDAELSIRVLGEVEAVGPDELLTSQQLSLLCYLACNGSSTRDMLVDAIWDGQLISKSRFPNLLAETRARIGRHHFPEAKNGRYELHGVTTDLARFERAVVSAQRADTSAAINTLRSVLSLVRGVPLTPPSRRFWSWVGDETHLAARVEAMVADAAARLARMEQARGNLAGARWACEQGLLASPIDETLVVVLTEVYIELGKPGLASRLVDDWEDHIGRLNCGEPSEEPRKRLAG